MANEEKSYGWLGVDMPMQVKIRMALIQRAIDPEDLYTDKSGFGLDKNPHVTVAYGHEENDPESTRQAIEDIGSGEGRLGGLSTFNNKDYNVLKFDVDSDHLRSLNKRVRERIAMPGQTFKDYNPHVTVAYLKPGVDVEKYRKLEKLLKTRRFPVKMIRFSNPKNENRTLLLKEVLKKSAKETIQEGNAVGQVMNMNPTEAQIDAENYKKAHIDVDGLKISIENPVGSTRSGTDKGGKEWTQDIWDDYGYIKGTKGYDKDHVDVFINPGLNGKPDTVYVLNQLNDDDQFDEHKCLIGYASKASARASYLQNYEDDWDRDGTIVEMVWEDFKKWCKSGLPAKGECTEESIQKVANSKAVLVTGNPKWADKSEPLYEKLTELLKAKGYDVSRDPGEEHTTPDESADVWLGHSRGTGRLKYAPKGVNTIAVGSKGGINHPDDDAMDEDSDPTDAHFELTDEMRENISKRLKKVAKIILDIDVGDTVLVGRFKNKPVVVKDIATDANGQPTINGRKLLALRIKKLMPKKKKAATSSAASKKLRKGKGTAKAALKMRKQAESKKPGNVRRLLEYLGRSRNDKLSDKHGIDIKESNWFGRKIYKPAPGAKFHWSDASKEADVGINIDLHEPGTAEYASALAHELKHYNDYKDNRAAFTSDANKAAYERAAETEAHKAIIKHLVGNGMDLSDHNLALLRKAWAKDHYWTDGAEKTEQAFDYKEFYDDLLHKKAETSHTKTIGDNTYDVGALLAIVKARKAKKADITSLPKPNRSKKTGFQKARYEEADPKYPLLYNEETGELIDGRHRLAKATDEGLKSLKYIPVTNEDMESVKMRKQASEDVEYSIRSGKKRYKPVNGESKEYSIRRAIAKVNGLHAGSAKIVRTSDDENAFESLSVVSGQRGKGIGRELAKRLLQDADKRGVESVTLRANPYMDEPIDKEKLMSFYKTMGFESTDDDGRMVRKKASDESLSILDNAINRAEGITKEAGAGKAGLIGAGLGATIGGVGGYMLAGEEDKEEAALAGAVLGGATGAVTGIAGAALLAKLKESPVKNRDSFNIPKKRGLLDVKQAYKNIYGDRLDEEVEQADAAARKIGAPWSNKEKLERLLRYKEDSAINARILMYDYDEAGVEPPDGRADPQTVYLPHEDAEERRRYSESDLKRAAQIQDFWGDSVQVEGGIKPDEFMEMLEGDNANETMMHEVNHFVTAGDHPSKTKEFTDKAMTDEGIDVGEDLWDITYPEYRSLEVTPPLSAMQHWWFKRTGDRIENDSDYEEAINILESTDDAALPSEVRRLKRYREHMDKRGKLENYDNVNKRLLPTIVKNKVIDFLMGDNVKKVAEEVEHINTGLNALNKALNRAEGK